MAAWTASVLSTTSSIARHQYNINSLCTIGQDWNDKIAIAHQKLGNDLVGRLYNNIDTLDDIENTDTLELAQDYMTIALIYTQLSANGLNELFMSKRDWYFRMYSLELSQAIPRIKIYNEQPLNPAGQFVL